MSTLQDTMLNVLAKYTEGIALTENEEEYVRLSHATVTALNRAVASAMMSDAALKAAADVHIANGATKSIITAALNVAGVTKGEGNA